jgi:hypothetical protein
MTRHRWLDKTPMSRILTRFSQDISTIDTGVPFVLIWWLELSFNIVITATTVVAVAGWVMLIPAFVVIQIGLVTGKIYMAAQLSVKRLRSNAKAPVISQIQATITGLGESRRLSF